MLNEGQHKLLIDPKVQMLIKALDCEVADTQGPIRDKISSRVQGWITSLQNSKSGPRVIVEDRPASQSPADVAEWQQKLRTVHGPGYVPFFLTIAIIACIGVSVRQPVDHPPRFAVDGKVKNPDLGPSKLFQIFSKHNRTVSGLPQSNYLGQKRMLLSSTIETKGYLGKVAVVKLVFAT